MNPPSLTMDQRAALATLANGIIPADARDAGAAAVQAGPRLAERTEAGVHAALYLDGLANAERLAQELFGRAVPQLAGDEVDRLLTELRGKMPAFFKQLRMDVSALYLSDPAVWQRIGFPGPSTATGGYPDFDQPQAPREG